MSTVADYTELVQDLMTIDGQISGLGMEIAVFGMFVNMDLLKECGIEKAPPIIRSFWMPVRRLRMRGIRQLPAAEKTEQDWRFSQLPGDCILYTRMRRKRLK